MGFRFLSVMAVAAVVLCRAGPTTADDGAGQTRLPALRGRVGSYLEARKNLVIECPTCGGTGVIVGQRVGVNPGVTTQRCPYCEGHGRCMSKVQARKVLYDFMSPSWRAQAGSLDAADKSYRELDQNFRSGAGGTAADGLLSGYRIDRIEPIGDHHASAWTLENGVGSTVESRWVWQTEPKTRLANWYRYGGEVDGVWGESGAIAAPPTLVADPPPIAPPGKFDPLDADALDEAKQILSILDLANGVERMERAGTTLALTLSFEGTRAQETLEEDIASDAVKIARAVLVSSKRFGGVSLVFQADWRDRFGAVARAPYLVASISKSMYEKASRGAEAGEVGFAFFATQRLAYEGKILWAPGDALPTAGTPLLAAEEDAARSALASISSRFSIDRLTRRATAVLVDLVWRDPPDEDALKAAMVSTAIDMTRALMGKLPQWSEVRWHFLTLWHDSTGKSQLAPYVTAAMPRTIFEKIVFEHLNQREIFDLFTVRRHRHPGWAFAQGLPGPLDESLGSSPVPATSGVAKEVPLPAPPGGAPAMLLRRLDRSQLFERGGDQGTERAVGEALKWLMAHQSDDGGWACAGFNKWCDGKLASGEGPTGLGKATYDPGVTGLALLAFLGAGYTNRGDHPFAKVVQNGLRYLKNIQDPEGCFGPRASGHFVYNHSIAALAMVEAYGMTGSAIYKGPAQKALDFIAIARNPYFAWRYGVKPGENDTSVTGWMMMALKSAKLINNAEVKSGKSAPLLIDDDAFDGIKTWIEKMTDPDYGRVGYIQRGTGPARPADLVDRFPAEKSEAMTAVAMLARVFAGEDPNGSELLRKGAELCAGLVPTWNPSDGSLDMYYWYYATLAMFQVGGDPWKKWNDAMRVCNVDSQHHDTDYCMYKGSWDNVDPWGPDGGRVYSTAIMALCPEVYYRYPRVSATVAPRKPK